MLSLILLFICMYMWYVYACVGIPVPYNTCRSHRNTLGSEIFPFTIGSRVRTQVSRLAQTLSALFLAKFIKQIPAIYNVCITGPFVFEPFELHESAYLKAYCAQHKTVDSPCLLPFYSVVHEYIFCEVPLSPPSPFQLKQHCLGPQLLLSFYNRLYNFRLPFL